MHVQVICTPASTCTCTLYIGHTSIFTLSAFFFQLGLPNLLSERYGHSLSLIMDFPDRNSVLLMMFSGTYSCGQEFDNAIIELG